MEEIECIEEHLITLKVWCGVVSVIKCCPLNLKPIARFPLKRLREIAKDGNLIKTLTRIIKLNHYNKDFIAGKYTICGKKTSCSYENFTPTSIKINCDACNLRCKMCRQIEYYTKEEELSSVDDYYEVLEMTKGYNLDMLYLTTGGEPFFDFNKAYDFLKSITSNDFKRVGIVTNATLLDEDRIRKLSELKNVKLEITVSCDSICEETYKKIRKNNMFNKVMDNITKLKEAGLLNMINIVIQEDNVMEIENMVEYWLSRGIKPNLILVRETGTNELLPIKDSEEVKRIISKYNKYLEGH